MGKVVAFSSFESRREKKPSIGSSNRNGEILIFTGIRYERMGRAEDSKTKVKISDAGARERTNRTAG